MKEWSVQIEAFAPKDKRGSLDPDDNRVGDLLDALAEWGAVASVGLTEWAVRLTVEADSIGKAVSQAQAIVLDEVHRCRWPAWEVERIEAIEADRLGAQLEVSNFPDIVGPGEAAEILGVSRQRVHELRSTGQFPRPMVELGIGAVWLRATIESFGEHRARKPGRRPKTVVDAANQILVLEEIKRDAGGELAPDQEAFWVEMMSILQEKMTVSEASQLLNRPTAWVFDEFMRLPQEMPAAD